MREEGGEGGGQNQAMFENAITKTNTWYAKGIKI